MIRSTLATLLTVVAGTPPAPAPSPGPTQPERAIIEARRPPIEADEVQPTEPPAPVAEPWTADRLAPFVKPSCYWAHTTKASRVRASTCFGADVLELPLVRTREVAKSACAGEACDDGPPLALVDHDLACWRDQQRPDETQGAGPERCDCDHVALVAGEPMLFCRRQWLDGDPFTTVVLYRLRDSRWTLALERTVRGYDLDKGETADLQIWVAGDELLLLGSKCALPNRPGSIAARICELRPPRRRAPTLRPATEVRSRAHAASADAPPPCVAPTGRDTLVLRPLAGPVAAVDRPRSRLSRDG